MLAQAYRSLITVGCSHLALSPNSTLQPIALRPIYCHEIDVAELVATAVVRIVNAEYQLMQLIMQLQPMHDEIAEAFIEHSQKIEQQQLLLSNILVDLDQAQQAALLIELTYKILNQTKRSHLVPNPALVAKHLQARASYGR
jgi:TolA-binding protein